MVQFRCTAPKAGLQCGLHHEDPGKRSLLYTMKSDGNEAVFQLHNLSATDSANYSCVYREEAPPISASLPSRFLKLTVNGLCGSEVIQTETTQSFQSV
ncbi:Alpha-1B-glycoprotein [Cricetulus griseus]|uniref:Alpha-1B-glycoprotein n=1 Tax=Cricetulus griseus TaxID=10029 RepID=G3IMK6_CRIGR|nr:Alpha-1B-glycoprotein [Cricetulus griseus]